MLTFYNYALLDGDDEIFMSTIVDIFDNTHALAFIIHDMCILYAFYYLYLKSFMIWIIYVIHM